jgi:hypothetical protein
LSTPNLSAVSLQQSQSPDADAYRARLRAANISDESFLATDYLNHFNEIVMLLQLVADMPDMLEEVCAWTPRSYVDHFRASSFANRDLAIEAYYNAPDHYRAALVMLVDTINGRVARAIATIKQFADLAMPDRLRLECDDTVRELGALIDQAGAVINGDFVKRSAQADIDLLIAEN